MTKIMLETIKKKKSAVKQQRFLEAMEKDDRISCPKVNKQESMELIVLHGPLKAEN